MDDFTRRKLVMNIKKPHALLDTLLTEHKLKTDLALAKQLGVHNSSLCKVRAGDQEVTDVLRVAVMRRFRWSLRRVDELAPPKVKS